MPADSRSKNGVAQLVIGPATSGRTRWLAYVAGIHDFAKYNDVDDRNRSGHDTGATPPASHIAFMADAKTAKPATSKCPICGKPADAVLRPFCSKRCADVDLHRWLSGVYVVPVTEDEEEDERRQERENESDESPQ